MGPKRHLRGPRGLRTATILTICVVALVAVLALLHFKFSFGWGPTCRDPRLCGPEFHSRYAEERKQRLAAQKSSESAAPPATVSKVTIDPVAQERIERRRQRIVSGFDPSTAEQSAAPKPIEGPLRAVLEGYSNNVEDEKGTQGVNPPCAFVPLLSDNGGGRLFSLSEIFDVNRGEQPVIEMPAVLRRDWSQPRPYWFRPRSEDKQIPSLHKHLVACSFANEDAVDVRLQAPPSRCDRLSTSVYRAAGTSSITMIDVASLYVTELLGDRATFVNSTMALAASFPKQSERRDGLINAGGALTAFFRVRYSLFAEQIGSAIEVTDATPGVTASPLANGTFFDSAFAVARATVGGSTNAPRWTPELWRSHSWTERNAFAASMFIRLFGRREQNGGSAAAMATTRCSTCTRKELVADWVSALRVAPRTRALDARPVPRGSDASTVDDTALACLRVVAADMLAVGANANVKARIFSSGAVREALDADAVRDAEALADGFADVSGIVNLALDLTSRAEGASTFRWAAGARSGGCARVMVVALIAVPKFAGDGGGGGGDEGEDKRRAASLVDEFLGAAHERILTYINRRISRACVAWAAESPDRRNAAMSSAAEDGVDNGGDTGACPLMPLRHGSSFTVHPVHLPLKTLQAAQRARADGTDGGGAAALDRAFFGNAARSLFMRATFFGAARAFTSLNLLSENRHGGARPTHVAIIPVAAHGAGRDGGDELTYFSPVNARRFLCNAEVRAADAMLLAPLIFVPVAPSHSTPTILMNLHMFSILARMAVVTSRADFTTQNARARSDDGELWLVMTQAKDADVADRKEPVIASWLRAVGLERALYTAFDPVTEAPLQVVVTVEGEVQMSSGASKGQQPSHHGPWNAFAVDGLTAAEWRAAVAAEGS